MRNRRVPVIVGTDSNDTASTVKKTELAGKLGADAALGAVPYRRRTVSSSYRIVVVPYYSRPSQEGILEHFRKTAQVGVPVIACISASSAMDKTLSGRYFPSTTKTAKNNTP